MSCNGAPAAPRAYRAVFFDLDGTLLPMEVDDFMTRYFTALGGFIAARGLDVQAFTAGLKSGIKAMALHGPEITNEQAFFQEFFRHADQSAADWDRLLAEFYGGPFGQVGDGVVPDPAAARAVDALAAKGYPLVLATMPMFPRAAVEWRLRWAGVDPSRFARITTFDNSTSVKPKLPYFAENLAAAGVRGSDVLMVGNNTVEDLAILDAGADAFLVTDHLIDAEGYDLSTVKHGSLAAFAAWVDQLPACAQPADTIEPGAVDGEAAQRAYEANVVLRRTDEEAMRVAARAYPGAGQHVADASNATERG
ncbi:MAG TPA: HAD family hydrolase [Candidatus Aphodovivens avistercoris]|nr:HAD family hydrolase [Candidatus Aphodovivens avistercoris]